MPPAAERRPRAWVLNLDCEHELAAGRRYAPNRHLAALVARQGARLRGTLVASRDVVVDEAQLERWERGGRPQALLAQGLEGFAWSPTPRARRLLERAGAVLAPAPDAATLAAVNARPFAVAVRQSLDSSGASFAKHVAADLECVLALVERPAALGWLVRRTFGAAGRGRRRLAAGRPSAAEHAWLVASLRHGPLAVEPWVAVTREHTRSGWVHRDGRVVVAPPCFQRTTQTGAWIDTVRAERDVARGVDRRLEEAAARAGEALAARGYFGPFGIDAFDHRPLGSGPRAILNPLSEINARFTMDWMTGMAPARGSARTGQPEPLTVLDGLASAAAKP